jgi:hypothetical protein
MDLFFIEGDWQERNLEDPQRRRQGRSGDAKSRACRLRDPDGRALFYTKTDQNTKLWRSAVDGSGETEVLDGVFSRGFVVTADRVYYLRQEPNGSTGIQRFVIAAREDSQIASLAKPVLAGLSMSPDGKYLHLFAKARSGSLTLVEDFH